LHGGGRRRAAEEVDVVLEKELIETLLDPRLRLIIEPDPLGKRL
jgi:hypothetical protein